MNQDVRVRFAPSPTGPLHIGGVRTALYNYLYAKKMGGVFVLRIEDTDQTRYIPGAEDYIRESLEWLGLTPQEGPGYGGEYGPYRQSERKELYQKYAQQLVDNGHAYYAFDTPAELEAMREREAAKGFHSAKYDHHVRMNMKNSMSLTTEETKAFLDKGENVTIRLKVPENETVTFNDIVREEVSFETNELDDKVILKKDGMPTYHLANIVDDHLMKISHVIRGEEWLSSTAHHVLLYRFFDWQPPVFTHLPLILKPTGKGKLSKRDGAKFGFPVFPIQWNGDDETYHGFREEGYDPEALLNFLVLLGWNPGNDEEIMDSERMTELFSLDKIVKSGARFDVDKALWFNHQYILVSEPGDLLDPVKNQMVKYLDTLPDDEYLLKVIQLLQSRVHSYDDFFKEGEFFYKAPKSYDEKQVLKRYHPESDTNFNSILDLIDKNQDSSEQMANAVKQFLSDNELKMGVYLPLLRIMMCGSLKGPDLFEIIQLLGYDEVKTRMESALKVFKSY
ncbi:MAG: glutamate--tRNA ligase [Saprospiraceae bacterium]|nr:glutamate--tRNA ligase [Saprospiraceae bacterium]